MTLSIAQICRIGKMFFHILKFFWNFICSVLFHLIRNILSVFFRAFSASTSSDTFIYLAKFLTTYLIFCGTFVRSSPGTFFGVILVNAFNCRFQLRIVAMRSLVIFCRRQLFAFVGINCHISLSLCPTVKILSIFNQIWKQSHSFRNTDIPFQKRPEERLHK